MALRPYSREGQFWGPSPDTVLAADHLARVVDEFIESLPLQRLNRRYEHTPGEAAYDIRLLCKIWIFAYARGLTSARELARQCEENLAFRFLTDGHCPDHRTLSGFRRRYRRLPIQECRRERWRWRWRPVRHRIARPRSGAWPGRGR